jgi:translation initiation factor IF-2
MSRRRSRHGRRSAALAWVWVWLQVIAGAAVIIAVWRFALQAPAAPPPTASIARMPDAEREPPPATEPESTTPAPPPAAKPPVAADAKAAPRGTVAPSSRTVATSPKPAPTPAGGKPGDDPALRRKPTVKGSPPPRISPAVAPRDASAVVDTGARERPRKPTPTTTVEPPPRGDEPDDVAVRWNRASP